MAFFKFRKDGDEHTTPPPAPESVEAMRKRAKHRLIGAAVLVALGVVGFPLLFDNQPRPIPVDLPISIPDKNTVKPLATPPVANATHNGAKIIDETASPEPAPVAVAPAAAVVAPAAAVAPASPAASRSAAGSLGAAAAAAAKTATKPVEKPVEKAAAPKTEISRAQALLEGKQAGAAPVASQAASSTSAPAVARFVVQVGAFSDVSKAREARIKLESAGLKTYTQVVTPKEGKRIRVRVGPFESKAEADKAAVKIKKLDLPAAVLEL